MHAYEYERHIRARKFLASIHWDELIWLASQLRDDIKCRVDTRYSIGDCNVVRRTVFTDGISWVTRLRLPKVDILANAKTGIDDLSMKQRALDYVERVMQVEVATMRFLN